MTRTITQLQPFSTGLFSRLAAFKLYYKHNQTDQAKPSTFGNNNQKGLVTCSCATIIHLIRDCSSRTSAQTSQRSKGEVPCFVFGEKGVEDKAHVIPSLIQTPLCAWSQWDSGCWPEQACPPPSPHHTVTASAMEVSHSISGQVGFQWMHTPKLNIKRSLCRVFKYL